MSRKSEESLVVLGFPRPEPSGLHETSLALSHVRSFLHIRRLFQAFLSFGPSRLLLFLRPRFGKSKLARDRLEISSHRSRVTNHAYFFFRLSHFPRLLLEMSRSRAGNISITAQQSVVSSATDVIQVQAPDSRAKKANIFSTTSH